MKIRSLFLAMAACVGLFSACTNDVVTDELIGNGSDSEKNAYASFSFVMPNSGGSTRATSGQGGDGSEVGSKVENDFTEAYILLFEGEVLKQPELLTRGKFTPIDEGNLTVYSTKEDIKVAAGTYNVYVVLNPTALLKAEIAKTPTYTNFKASVEAVDATKGEYCTDGHFMMTNADEIVTTEVTVANTQGNAKEVSINVERLAAKITFVPKDGTDNIYAIHDVNDKDKAIGTVAFDAYKVINTRNSAFNLRRVSDGEDATKLTIGGKEIAAAGAATNYVVENEWAMKAAWNLEAFKKTYSRKHTDYVAFRKLTATTGSQTLAYCLENTMPKGQQIEGYSTTVILRAKTSLKKEAVNGLPDDYADATYSGNIYKYAGQFFASRQAIISSENPKWDNNTKAGLTNNTLGVLTYLNKVEADNVAKEENEKTVINQKLILDYLKAIEAKKLYDNYGAEFYANGNCYYKVILRHSDNKKATEMGVMEFAIVRNNVYKLAITSVNFLGSCSSGTPGAPDPENPGTGEPDVDPSNPNPEIPGEVVTPDPENPEPVDPVIPVDPTTPDEKHDTYLNVTIKVLDWIVRDNGVIL